MTAAVRNYTWPWARLDEALADVVEHLGGPAVGGVVAAALDATPVGAGGLGLAVPQLCARHGLDGDAYPVYYGAVARLPAPALVRVDASADTLTFLVVASRHAGHVVVLGPDRQWHRLPLAALEADLHDGVDAEARHDAQNLLTSVAVEPTRHARAVRALLGEQLAHVVVAEAWHLSLDAGSALSGGLRREGVLRQAWQLAGMHAAQFGLWLAAWALIGRGALDGRVDWGWMTAWALLIATMVPVQIWSGWTQGAIAIGVGRVLKRRFLAGAMRLEPDAVRVGGAGQMLGRVLESGAFETMTLSGGLLALTAAVELLLSGWALAYGTSGAWLVAWLASCVAAALVAGAVLLRRRGEWADTHLSLTHHLVERIAGHRTRLAQERPERRHDDEDVELAAYTTRGRFFERTLPALLVGLPRTWLAGGLVLLLPAFAQGAAPDRLAIAIGGMLLATGALRRGAEGMVHLAGAAIAWRQARPLFAAAARLPVPAQDVAGATTSVPVVQLREVSFQYPVRSASVLRDCSLTVEAGDRVLLEGPSGGGKSTLAAIVAGLRMPTSGLVLAGGFDHATLGPHGWRQRVVCAPQFHENHVFCETFAFNLLMGRHWPPTPDDEADADTVARELGLGPLLDRMPAGMMQMVGEGGWQLSHGERSRLFVARALLQNADLVVLDESLAALDPETSQAVLDCIATRARSLMVIAHE